MKSQGYGQQSGVKVLNEPFASYGQRDLVALASMMITKAYIKEILDLSRLTLDELMEIIPISIDTYKRKTEFNPSVTEKILEIQEVYERGTEAFGDAFYHWMATPNVALGGIIPKMLLKNSFGIRRLINQIGRIEHGIYS